MIWNRGAQIARTCPKSLSRAAHIALSNRAFLIFLFCDLNLCFTSPLESQCQFLIQQVRTMNFRRRFTLSQIASDLRFEIRITNHNRSKIARFGALRSWSKCHNWLFYSNMLASRTARHLVLLCCWWHAFIPSVAQRALPMIIAAAILFQWQRNSILYNAIHCNCK